MAATAAVTLPFEGPILQFARVSGPNVVEGEVRVVDGLVNILYNLQWT